MNTKINLTLLLLISNLWFSFSAYAWANPETSNISSCAYKIEWYKIDELHYDSNWVSLTAPECNTDIDFSSVNWNVVPDWIYDLHFKAEDSTVDPGHNVYPDTVFKRYFVDTVPVKCVLNSITLAWMKNQYYNDWKLYYKQANDAEWEFTLDITCRDTTVANKDKTCYGQSCVSQIDTIDYPLILWDTNPDTLITWDNEKKDLKLTYKWSWYQNDTFDILNLPNTFATDWAWNTSVIDSSSTDVIFLNDSWTEINRINNITSLILTPDGDAPLVNGSTYDISNLATNWQSIQYKTWNNWDLSFESIYENWVSNIKPMTALDARKLKIPSFNDNKSWLSSFELFIEKYDNKWTTENYWKYQLSNLNTKITDFSTTEIEHNFSNVSWKDAWWFYMDYDNDWSRYYSWKIKSYYNWDSKYWLEEICDMVNNCISYPTPDFQIVANEPLLANSTNNISIKYENNLSDYSSKYNLKIDFRDKYNNEVVPVNWVKDIWFTFKLKNSLWVNQLDNIDSELWNWVWFTFKDWNNDDIDSTFINEYHDFQTILSNRDKLDKWELNISIKSAVPTYDEYMKISANPAQNKSLYWSATAELKFTNFKIDVIDKTSNNSVWEFNTVGDSFVNELPEFKFDPVLTFNSIWNIYPLVEWQVKDMTLSKIHNENIAYSLNIYTWTKNNFLQITQSRLKENNTNDWAWDTTNKYNNYLITNITWVYPAWKWNMPFNSNENVFQILPQSISWISSDDREIALYSELEYKVWWKIVKLPSIQTWFKYFWIHTTRDFDDLSNYEDDSKAILSEVKITWITQTNNKTWNLNWDGAVTTDDSTFNDFSKITLFDLKTSVNKNLAKLLRWVDMSDATKLTPSDTIDISDLNSFNAAQGLVLQWWDILYVKDRDVEIKCSNDNACWISGKKTIIVENGNINLKSDLFYTDEQSILWIILVWNDSSWDESELRIDENITNGVWIIYSEWPVVSVDWSNNMYDGDNVWENLVNQLHWKWSFMTRNTIWWSIKTLNIKTSCPYGTPDYDKSTCTQERAQAYDLIYLRRYARVNENNYEISTNLMGDSKVPLHCDSQYVKIAWGKTFWLNCTITYNWNSDLISTDSDSYDSPLIIEYDGNIQSNPPYVFE